jgi:glycosyltransferase involved in cell wall biosynthesis
LEKERGHIISNEGNFFPVKVIEVPFCFHPDPMGGTEVYVAALARELLARGVDALIAAPGDSSRDYIHAGIPVRRFAVRQEVGDLRELYGEGDELAAAEFAKILDRERPDLVHLHAFTRGVSLRLVRSAKARGIPVLLTYHTPTVTCQRGTMMRWGKQPCDGLMDLHNCARCTLDGLTSGKAESRKQKAENGRIHPLTNRLVAKCFGSLPPALGSWLGRRGLQGGMWTALRMTELVQLRHGSVRALLEEVDHVVAVCEWVRQVLLRNGVPEGKITLCRQGISIKAESTNQKSNFSVSEFQLSAFKNVLRLCFFGRLDPTKGVHILLQALRLMPQAPLRLDIFGIAQGEAGRRYEQELKRLSANDSRIAFLPPVPPDKVVGTLAGYDLLAVPSQWLETGPLVVLEAFAARVPVLGSRLGGIAELVRDGIDGILVEPDSVPAWAAALQNAATNLNFLNQMKANIRSPRTMTAVADEMLALYESSTIQEALPNV